MPSAVRIVVTGAPGAGKSTLLDELALLGIAVSREAARDILRKPGGMALRAERPLAFAQAMFEAERRAFTDAGERGGLTVFDRGFPDIVGFLQLESLPVPEPITAACRNLRYDQPVFRAPPWPAIYRQDAERIQDWNGAVASDAAVCAAWRRCGYELVDLPLAPARKRAEFLGAWLDAAG